VHTGRGSDENLNSPGMHFVPLAFDDTCVMPDRSANLTPAQPLLRLWRDRAAGDAGGIDRTR